MVVLDFTTVTKDLEKYSISFSTDGIVIIDIKPDVEISIEEIIEGTNFILSIVKEKKLPILFIANEFSIPSKESREYLAKKESLPYAIADAYVICSFPQKIVGNFYLKVNKPFRPTKLFTDKNEALKWLKTFL